MATSIDILEVRRILGRSVWQPPEPFGPDGWSIVTAEPDYHASILISCADHDDGTEWVHASIAHPDRTPTYDELKLLHRAVWRGRGFAYQVFADDTSHVNIHSHALHLWGRLDGANVLPDFAAFGTI